ncbi:MAG: DNA-protecting protein DprA [Candidatus Eremiobacteraeota bacterium]|nr:DNA-protecting protein DprA [Candidatus Eremiobacteraeota bacterium]MBC5803981.1 DNA-protecting protein DprA [Candidatus Eremiobacteraeota bacterium]MBC5820368.1 DNA-protecting protein DprA [Candidatus Eremiobacteraeota bacterium]
MSLDRPRFCALDDVFAARPAAKERLPCAGAWVAGSWPPPVTATVAVVGSRAPSEAGRSRAQALGDALARAGVCVVSGLALGIDAAAHAGALAGGGRTIGVLGGGHRQFFPPRNRGLAAAMIAAGGAVLSPYAPDEPARPYHFLQRNGLVAALADAVVIVEAAERSGALNTAGWAASLGIDVLAYPGDVDRPKAAGCNALIRDGATLARGPADVLAAIGLHSIPLLPNIDAGADDPLETALLTLLGAGPCNLDALVDGTQAGTGDVVAALVRLELAGRAERRASGYALPP